MNNQIINMPDEAEIALDLLNMNGFDAYLVGGCVRDSILGIEPEDWDITTSALPNDIIKCFDKYRIIETGLKHGTVTVIINKVELEITTYRIDGKYLDNRRPDSVKFTDNIALDLERRDFTINAIGYNNRGIIDLFAGVQDIHKKEIKCVGDPDKRFNEDGLRILRALRFASVLGFKIEVNTSNSIHKNKELLNNISSERLSAEFSKLITGINFKYVMTHYADVISVFIPGIKNMLEFNGHNDLYESNVWQYTLMCMANVPNDLSLRLVMLLHHIVKEPSVNSQASEKILHRLKYDRSTIELVKTLILYHDEEILPNSKNIKIWLNKIGEPTFKKLLEVKKTCIKSQQLNDEEDKLNIMNRIEIIAEEVIKNNQCYNLKGLAVNGNDLIGMGINEGEKVGEILNELLSMVIEEKLDNDRDKLLDYLKSRKIN